MGAKADHKQVKELIKRAGETETFLRNALDSQKNEIAAVRQAADAFYNERLKNTLEGISVDILAQGKQGIRVSYLKDADITNIYQLSKLSEPVIEAINGIGDQSAKKIYTLTQQIVDNTKKKLSVRINADEPTQGDDALIRALFTLIRHDAERPQMHEIYKQNRSAVQGFADTAAAASSAMKWMFASKSKKEEALKAAEMLEQLLEEKFGENSPNGRYRGATTADITECRAHFRENSAEYYSALEKYCKHLDTSEALQTGLSEELLAEIEAQEIDLKYMKATLRGYQNFGVKYAVHQKRTLLGDEMGLGKTIQAIACMAALKAAGKHHFMVVCPASVLINWAREIEKHSQLAVTKVHGADEESLLHWRENGDVAVTTYESISRFELPEKFTFDMLVVDEAHYVKNPEAQRTVAMQKLLAKTESVLYMSGTPLVNRVDEMCFLVNCLQPEISAKLENVKNISTADQFRQELAPVYLRRVRADVLKELPDLIEKEQWCELSEKEQSIYREAVASGNLMAIRQVSWQMEELKESSKAMRLLEICDSAKEQGRKIIVFSFFRNTLNKVCQLLGDRCSEIISGDIPPARRQEIVDKFNAAEEGAVLVSQVQAGGMGLNIQAASVIVFCEPQLTPAIESQAVGRAYRMG
ncbi:MAG: DEAD/DEAH box helicase family protein, partial [Oscillospiraceae bacterium]|nr:DEAD/DEAH box helicase family protein [Oscillospiraceae bacterium]